MGEIYLARDVRLGRVVALKVVGQDLGERAGAQRQLAHEARATANLTHPNIVTLYDVGEHEGRVYIALEYVRGRTLAEALREGPLPLHEGLRVMREIAAAIAAAHAVGVTHRDLKPGNILLGEDGRTRVLDFGIARITRRLQVDDEALALRGGEGDGLSVIGTPRYMAPEQWDSADGPPTDVWAFGVVAHALLTQRHLLPRLSEHARLAAKSADTVSLSAEAKQLPREVVEILEACVQKDPAARPTATELVALLDPEGPSAVERAEACPFPGLSPYDRATASSFAGRDEALRTGLELLALDGLLVVVGPPSVGKTSFVAATISRLRERHAIEVLSLRAGPRPFHALATALEGWSSALEPSEIRGADATLPDTARPLDMLRESAMDVGALAWTLEREPTRVPDLLRGLAKETERRVVVVMDDLEALVGRGAANEDAEPFVAACLEAAEADGEVSLVWALRDDALGRIPWGETQSRVLASALFLRQPDAEDLAEMVREPLARVGYRLEDEEAAARLGRSLGGRPNALPLLQFAMREAWRERDPETRTIPRAVTDALSDPSRALATHADRVIDAFDKPRLELTRRLLLRLVTQERRLAQVAAEELAEELGLQALPLLDRLLEEGLLQRDESDLVALAHEALLDSWPRLRRWLEESDVAFVRLRELELAAQQWIASGATDDGLLSGDALRDGERALASLPDRLSEEARRLVTRSVAARARAVRQRRIRRAVLALAAVLVVLAGLVSVWALDERARTQAEARARTERDRVRLLSAGARGQYLRGDPLRALAMARAALESDDDLTARALVDEMRDDPLSFHRELGGVAYEAALDAGESAVYLASQTGRVLRVDTRTGEVEGVVEHEDQVTALALTDDGAIVSVDWGGALRVTQGERTRVIAQGVRQRSPRSLVVVGDRALIGRVREPALRVRLDGRGEAEAFGPTLGGSASLARGADGELWLSDTEGRLVALAADGEVLHAEPVGLDVRAIDVGTDGRLALATSQSVIAVYDPGARRVVARWPLEGDCRFARWLAPGTVLAGCGPGLYVLREGDTAGSPRDVDGSLLVAADVGARLVAVTTAASGVFVFHRDRLLAPHREAPPDRLGLSVAAAPRHDLAFMGTQSSLHVFELSTGRHLRRVDFGVDARRLIATDDALLVSHGHSVTRFALPSLARTQSFATNRGLLFSLALDGDRVYAGSSGGSLYTCGLSSGLIEGVVPVAGAALRGIAPTPGPGWAVAAGPQISIVLDGAARPLATLPADLLDLTWHARDEVLLATDLMGGVWAVDPGSGEATARHQAGARAYSVAVHGAAVGVASADDRARIWDGAGPPTLLDGHRGEVNAITFVDGGRRALTASDDATLRLWDVASGAPLWRRDEAEAADSSAQTLSAVLEGRRWSGAEDGAVTRDDGALRLPNTETVPVTLVAEGPGGTLVVGFANGVVGLWDVERLERLRGARLHGAVVAATRDGDDLHVFSELGDRLALHTPALSGGRCRALQLLWGESALVWAAGRLQLRAPPAHHPCR